MSLYRYDEMGPTVRPKPSDSYVMRGDTYIGELVPVEPCSHGNYARHVVLTEKVGGLGYYWCDGKPKENDDG